MFMSALYRKEDATATDIILQFQVTNPLNNSTLPMEPKTRFTFFDNLLRLFKAIKQHPSDK